MLLETVLRHMESREMTGGQPIQLCAKGKFWPMDLVTFYDKVMALVDKARKMILSI